LFRRLDGLLEQGQGAFGIDHHPVGLRPQGGRQHHVGVLIGLGLQERVLGDHQFGLLQTGQHGLPIGHGGNGVGADDPARLDIPVGQAGEHVDHTVADVGAQRTVRYAPLALHELPVFAEATDR